jgi:23S rRNA pseudouridine1911/1915/1917 synthase
MEIQVLYEDEDTLVINKPVDLVVNRAASVFEFTIQDWVELRLPEVFNTITDKLFRERSGVCHRLDKETSGCLMIAKNTEALRYYLSLFKDRKITKEYVALVHGRVEPNEGDVILPLRRSMFDREKFQVHYEGKRAVTGWKVLDRFIYPGHEHWRDSLTYLRVFLKTGRTHQIRVHLSFLGWPIFSDYRYLNKKFGRQDRHLLSHHFLHAAYLSFKSFQGEIVKVEAPLPEDCQEFLETLEKE